MSKATFTTDFGIKNGVCAGVFALACAGHAMAAPAPTAPVRGQSVPALVQEQHAPASSAERLYRLDQLRADLEEAKLRAQIAKANQDAKGQTASPNMAMPGGAVTPPLPGMGTGNSASLGLIPPLPSQTDVAGRAKGLQDLVQSASAFEVLETFGVGKARQAIVNMGGTKRIVHVGDRFMGGTVVSIGAATVNVRQNRGYYKSYE